MQHRIATGRVQANGPANWTKRGLIFAGAIAVLALGISGYRMLAPTQQAPAAPAPVAAPAAVSVKTAQATNGSISTSLSYSADVKASSQVAVVPKASGRIERLTVDVGSKVKRGDVIAQLDSASLQAGVTQARANLAAAQARVSALTEGARPEQVGQAQAALESAQARRDQVRKGANDAQRQGAASAADQAKASLASARASVSAAQAGLDTLKAWPTQREWAQSFAAVDTAKANVRAAEERFADVKAGPKPAELLAATQAVEASYAALLAKGDGLQVARDNGTPVNLWGATGTSLGQSQESLVAARTAYEAAKANLALLQSRPLPWELQAAQSNVEAARASLNAANAAVDQMKRGSTPEDITRASSQVTAAENSVKAAEAGLATAEANLRQVQDGATEEELRMADASVVQATEALSLAANPYRAADYEQARAGVAQAQAALQAAEIALSEAVVISPVDGIVSDRTPSEGQLVGPSAPMVTIVSSEVELSLGVEEAQVGQVSEGQKAEITVAAYPGQVFPARVSLIAPTADPKSRSFLVKVKPEASDGKLKAGMFANVRIVTAEKAGAVLVPKEAVMTKTGQTSVFVVTGDTVSQRQVKTGMASGNVVEVVSGLSSGEEVVAAGGAELRDGDRVKK